MNRLCSLVAVLAVSTVQADTIYVDDDVLCGDGSSWENALDDLQRALDIASETPSVSEIRVAGGVYVPTFQIHPQFIASRTFLVGNSISPAGGAICANSLFPRLRPAGISEFFPWCIAPELPRVESISRRSTWGAERPGISSAQAMRSGAGRSSWRPTTPSPPIRFTGGGSFFPP